MLKDNSQLKLSLSPYQGIYDAIIPANHLLRRIKENIDFSFVNPMLRKQYCEKFGRPAKEPEMMFKLLFLKKLYDLSDEALISSAQTDMAYKFFLDLEPEAKMIDPSLLTKFRKTRITEDILEEMLRETIQQALDKGLIRSGTIIVDSTHTNASVRAKSPTQILRDISKQLRKEIYKNTFELSEKFPEKPSLEAGLDEEIAYTRELLRVLEEGIETCGNRKIQELSKKMKELLEDEKIRDIRSKDDRDARFGHKTPTSTFYGYKNHLAMPQERLIAGISVTLIAKTNPAVAAAADKCPLKGQCKVGKGKTHSYSITQAREKNRSRLEFEASEKFQERLKIRHRIEEKNGELKEAHGLGRADSVGLFAMEVQMQMYFTAFAANIKRITKLIALAG